jgi:hypothetical protein
MEIMHAFYRSISRRTITPGVFKIYRLGYNVREYSRKGGKIMGCCNKPKENNEPKQQDSCCDKKQDKKDNKHTCCGSPCGKEKE